MATRLRGRAQTNYLNPSYYSKLNTGEKKKMSIPHAAALLSARCAASARASEGHITWRYSTSFFSSVIQKIKILHIKNISLSTRKAGLETLNKLLTITVLYD